MPILLDVFRQEPSVEIIPNRIVHKSLFMLRFRACLSLENDVIIPPVSIRST